VQFLLTGLEDSLVVDSKLSQKLLQNSFYGSESRVENAFVLEHRFQLIHIHAEMGKLFDLRSCARLRYLFGLLFDWLKVYPWYLDCFKTLWLQCYLLLDGRLRLQGWLFIDDRLNWLRLFIR